MGGLRSLWRKPRGLTLELRALQDQKAPLIRAPLALGGVRVGSGEECDICLMLQDDLMIEIETSGPPGFRRVWATLREGAANLAGAPMRPEERVRFAPGARIEMGGAHLRLLRPPSKARRLGAAGLIGAAAVMLALFIAPDRAPMPSALYSRAPSVSPETAQEDRAARAAEAAQALRERLESEGVGSLKVEALPSAATLLVTGALAPNLEEDWDRARDWFDERWGTSLALDARFSEVDDKLVLPFEIVALWSEPEPVAIDHTGARYRRGDTLPGGWRVLSIEPDALRIQRGALILTLEL